LISLTFLFTFKSAIRQNGHTVTYARMDELVRRPGTGPRVRRAGTVGGYSQ
jgi:hypothetical protein